MTLPLKLVTSLRDQAQACAGLGSPLTTRVLALLADRWSPPQALARRLADWPGDLSSNGASVPLRLAGALHALVRAGMAPELAPLYADPGCVTDAWLAGALERTLAAEEGFVLSFLDSPPQTNEVRRSAALIAGAQWLYRQAGLPLILSELGSSAGANLIWDRYALLAGGAQVGPENAVLTLTSDWSGPLPRSADHPPVLGRAGVDLNPLDPERDRERLLAYVWPDQPDRIERTTRALDEVARLSLPIARGDAVDWLAERLCSAPPGALHLIFHTIAWQYFPPDRQARGEDLLAAAGARAARDAPLARLSLEADGKEPGAALTATLWPGGASVLLARVDFHGRWIDWRAPWSRADKPPVD